MLCGVVVTEALQVLALLTARPLIVCIQHLLTVPFSTTIQSLRWELAPRTRLLSLRKGVSMHGARACDFSSGQQASALTPRNLNDARTSSPWIR